MRTICDADLYGCVLVMGGMCDVNLVYVVMVMVITCKDGQIVEIIVFF